MTGQYVPPHPRNVIEPKFLITVSSRNAHVDKQYAWQKGVQKIHRMTLNVVFFYDTAQE